MAALRNALPISRQPALISLSLIWGALVFPIAAIAGFGPSNGRTHDHRRNHKLERQLAEVGYVATRSGGFVDVSLAVIRNEKIALIAMGTALDMFEESSHTSANDVRLRTRTNQMHLVAMMEKLGFVNYR